MEWWRSGVVEECLPDDEGVDREELRDDVFDCKAPFFPRRALS